VILDTDALSAFIDGEAASRFLRTIYGSPRWPCSTEPPILSQDEHLDRVSEVRREAW
jgi:hypothetical protein